MGETIGPYRILEPLGHGGMGIVYRARHTGSERAIALKTVRVPAPKWLDSIRREVQALTRIRHPGVVRIVDHGVQNGRPWYAMDLVEGESLRRFGQRIWSPYRPLSTSDPPTEEVSETESLAVHWSDTLQEGEAPPSPRPPRADGIVLAAAGELSVVLGIMRKVCATLAFLHGEGFINGDLKPENVLLVGDQPVIIDFGLTAQHPGGSGREALEAQRGLAGTLAYMSPEQIRGEFLDARSDLYSVGCVLYELIAGVPPFTGAPRAVMQQHLTATPVPPSEIVSGVPSELEQLILKLLEKDVSDRYGYADEVAAELAEVSQDARRLSDLPPARSYLYRPRLVGREALLSQLTALRERAINGSGTMVLLGGESGVGKTRLAMELTRFAPSNLMRVVTSEASALSTDSAGAVAPAPLHALRSLLQAVADRCQEGGPEVSEALLGDRRSVLAMYEPVLEQAPGVADMAAPIPLGAEASRQRLFKYLSETLGHFTEEQPLLWVLDDVGWADELSLAFLRSLTAQFLETHTVFIVCTYRSEEPSEAVASLAALPHVTHLTVPRLGEVAVRSMISDMLALREPYSGFSSFVARQAEGNPFFVAEYLRTAVAERILHRDRRHSWQLVHETPDDPPDSDEPRDYEAISLPRSLAALIEHRLRTLSPAALQAGLAAAVLGRETELETLLQVASLSEEASAGALDELMRRQVLEQPEPQSVRFAHDKLREVTCARATPEQLRALHGRAASVLEKRWHGRPDASQQWATLGHHFAAAQQSDRAAKYLRLAADHASQTHANGDAIRLYQEAVNHVSDVLLRLESDPAEYNDTLIGLYEAFGDVLALTAQREQARAAYDQALGRAPEGGLLTRARLHRKAGKTWETQHQHEQALRHYGLARDAAATDPSGASPELRRESIQIQLEHLWVYYWLNRVPEMEAIVPTLAAPLQAYGTPSQRAQFFRTQMMLNMRRDRYVISDETLSFARSAVEACRNASGVPELPMEQFSYGFALLFHGSITDAERELLIALTLGERIGDTGLQSRCITYLTVAARMRDQIAQAEHYTDRGVEISKAAGTLEYLAAAHGNQAWLALRRGDAEAAMECGRQAMALWRSLTLVFPFQWLALLPLMAAALQRGDAAQAVSCAEPLLAPTQRPLPRTASDALERAKSSWHLGNEQDAVAALEAALRHLQDTEYH